MRTYLNNNIRIRMSYFNLIINFLNTYNNNNNNKNKLKK